MQRLAIERRVGLAAPWCTYCQKSDPIHPDQICTSGLTVEILHLQAGLVIMSSTPQTTELSTITGRLTTASGSLKKSVRRVPLPSLRLTVSERRLFLAIVDMLALSSALLAALVLHGPGRFSWDLVVQQPRYYLLLIGIWMISALFFDCYDLARTADASHSAWAAGRAALVTALAYLAVPYLTPNFLTSRLSSLLFVVCYS